MDIGSTFGAGIMGLVEGITEFLPVSSTGHMILIGDLIGFEGPSSKVFEIVIQLGAILAVVVVYFQRLWNVVIGLPRDPAARHFALTLIFAVLPALVIGAAAEGFIKRVLFNPWVVSTALVVGGFAILAIERLVKKTKCASIESMDYKTALKIGACQCLAMIPGVSRSGATIMGALLLGVERKTAAEFSFFLAIPTMVAATTYDLYKNWQTLNGGALDEIAIGFVVAFLSALFVVRRFIGFVGKYGFQPFAWYRIVVGVVMLVWLTLR